MFDMFLMGAMIDSILYWIFSGIGNVLSAGMDAICKWRLPHFGIAFGLLVLFGGLCMRGLGVNKS